MAHQSDREMIAHTRNTARFFTENRHISWVLLIGTIVWGMFGYYTMPKRKDPDIPVRAAVAIASWQGATARDVEDRVTRTVERTLAENSKIEKLESTTRAGVAVVTITLDKTVTDTAKEFDDIWLKLSSMLGLPSGAWLDFKKDFGDVSALMLTVASPLASDVELQLRATQIADAIRQARAGVQLESGFEPATLVACFPHSLDARELAVIGQELADFAQQRGATHVRTLLGSGFFGIDSQTLASDDKLLANAREFLAERMRVAEVHPDVWQLAVIRDPAETQARLRAVAGEKYSYRELDRFTDRLEKAMQAVPEVAKVTRSGVQNDVVYLEYSQEKLSAYGVLPSQIDEVLAARNIVARGGAVDLQRKSVLIAPDGEFANEQDIGAVIVTRSASGAPVYLRDLVSITRAYETPQYLAYSSWKDASCQWQRTRAITLSLTMKSGLQIADFGKAVHAQLQKTRSLLPEDLVVESVSDQPLQVEENVDLFMSSLYEAIVLVVLVALVGFWEWRSALLMALSIPITLAMTFGLMRMLNIDVQQVSIASLIIALGLLVDDPVVAGDAIKRDLNRGLPGTVAAWLGPTKLAGAIMFATLTNIVAYLPFLTLSGDSGRFIYSLPIVLTASLVASRLVSMSFIPLLGYYLLRPSRQIEPTMQERRTRGFARFYYTWVGAAIRHRWLVLGGAVVLLCAGIFGVRGVKQAFFPKDLSYLSYVDVWLPEDSPVAATRATAAEVDGIIREVGAPYGVKSVTTFVGGGGPRFWFSVAPEQRQSNYAQLVIRLNDKHETRHLVAPLQAALDSRVAGARIDVRQLESGPAVGIPVSIRVSGEQIDTLRELASRVEDIIRRAPDATRVRDTWGADSFTVKLDIDADRANAAGVTNYDVSRSSSAALNGSNVGTLYEGDHKVPIVARLRPSERQKLSDVENLYVYSGQNAQAKVPLRQISEFGFDGTVAKILRRNHARTITIGAFPAAGALPSEVLAQIKPELDALRAELPPGYDLTIGGEQEEQDKSFKDLVVVLQISIAAIFIALVLQFRNAVKPLVVFAAIPFGAVAALISLRVMDAPFGFMAFLGVISLIGVIVSHVIVLFDFIEEQHEAGAPLMEALLDAGILRLRPVLVTVGATVLGLFPLAMHGGPLWEPLCYVQIGGLTAATLVTLVLVPVLYAIFVLDLKLVRWDAQHVAPAQPELAPAE
ncbi:MAG TPA: efflux RND transporter permease subunit [Polyangiales bacterium]|nr:efflux RND transporter permease subunit [Polyangiales bacterium]